VSGAVGGRGEPDGAGEVLPQRVRTALGAGALSPFTLAALPSLLAGEPVLSLGEPDVSHSWTAVGEVIDETLAATPVTAP
jgi:hypothetical protein